MEWRISFACHCMMPGPSRIAQSRTLRSLYGMMGKLRRVMIQPMFSRRKSMGRAVLSTIVSVCAVLLTVQAQQPQTVLQGVYAENQARRGQTIYKAQCALCHGEMLEGRLGPPLTGDEFVSDFAKQPLSELFGKIRNTMPQDNPGKLTPQQTADILAYILQAGKFPSGRAQLSSDENALKQISWPADSVAASKPAAPANAAASFSPAGNMAQVMRGILFPNANIIF